MIPLRDNIPSRSMPVIGYLVIAGCALVFVLQLSERRGQESLVEQYGMIPARLTDPGRPVEIVERKPVRTPFGVVVREERRQAAEPGVPVALTLLTCIFLHGGWMHIIGNMWFLYIFGDNVEDRMGHLTFLVFYVSCGIAASLAHLATNPSSTVPTIGASGAIAGVMGAYFLLYPHAKVLTLVPVFYFLHMVVLPAPFFLGIWFLIQFFQGAFAITATRSSGVAWWAHIGGFVVGLAVAWLMRQLKWLRPAVSGTLPATAHRVPDHFRRHDRPWN